MKRKIALPSDWPEIPNKCGILRKLKAFNDFWVQCWNALGVYDFIKKMFLQNITTLHFTNFGKTGIDLGPWYSWLDFVLLIRKCECILTDKITFSNEEIKPTSCLWKEILKDITHIYLHEHKIKKLRSMLWHKGW